MAKEPDYKAVFEREVKDYKYSENGQEAVTTCLFCRKDGHLYFNVVKGLFICFRCNESGSAARFFMELKGMDYLQVVRFLYGERADVSFESLFERIQKLRVEPDFYAGGGLPKIIADPPPAVFNPRIKKWMEIKRGIPIRNLDTDIEVGQCLDVEDRWSKYYFRAIFSFNCAGHVSFQSYALNKRMKPKMLNPAGNSNPQLLFGYNDVRKEKLIMLHEGIFDRLRTFMHGYPSVACFGKALTEHQILLLLGTPATEINFCYDGDLPGIQGTIKSAKRLSEVYEGRITVTPMPKDKDPDKVLLEQDPEVFHRCFKERLDWKVFRVRNIPL